ncbi:hypothetical protein I8752_03495 [Nostocaceae cyanobacterium CENA369]|uniref:Uncharacterized protein n=1 Tax=Dendronalium phyllosphericum CENA369 TaxID=1725256 RepID=A0A8J7LCM5_9NOST|nr:hypothetical protein [Dendronalium phyllosphericum CENA369]
MSKMIGNDGNNIAFGTAYNDFIDGKEENDFIFGFGGRNGVFSRTSFKRTYVLTPPLSHRLRWCFA